MRARTLILGQKGGVIMCGKGWGYRCPAAKGPKCRCSCGGICHGKARGMSKAGFMEKARENPLWYIEENKAAEHRGG